MKIRYMYLCNNFDCDKLNECIKNRIDDKCDLLNGSISLGSNYILFYKRQCDKCLVVEHFLESVNGDFIVLFVLSNDGKVDKNYIYRNRMYKRFFVDDSFLDSIYSFDIISLNIRCQQLEYLRQRIFRKENLLWFVVEQDGIRYVITNMGLRYIEELNNNNVSIDDILKDKKVYEYIYRISSPEVLWNEFIWSISIKTAIKGE